MLKEKETLMSLEVAKAYFIDSSKASIERLTAFLHHGLAHSEIVEREFNMFIARFRKALFFSSLVDSFLDYFSIHGEPDDGITEAAMLSLAEAIRQMIQEESENE